MLRVDEALIRPASLADTAGIARVHVDSWRSSYRGIVPDTHLASLSYPERERRWQDHLADTASDAGVLVAEVAGKVVGFASYGPERTRDAAYRGELYAIYLLAAHQRRGLGRRLLRAVIADLVQRGMTSLLVWVLADNPSRGFYSALGGRPVRSQSIEIGGKQLAEIAYGWGDARTLLPHLRAE